MPLLIGLLAFAAVALAAYAFLQPKDDVVGRRIRGYARSSSARRKEEGLRARLLEPAARRIGASIARILPGRLLNTLERMLIMANSRMPVTIFLTIWAGCILLGAWLCLNVVYGNRSLSATQALLYITVVMLLFAMAPYMLLRHRVKTRQKRITRALPDALDLLVTGVEAGLGVDAAFAMVTEKTTGPFSECLALYLHQVGLGRARRDAFLDVAERSGVVDLIRVATSVAQAEQMGAILGDVLRIQASDLRTLRRQRAQEAAQRAPVLMTIPMASCFLPAMAAVVIIPSALNLMAFFTTKR